MMTPVRCEKSVMKLSMSSKTESEKIMLQKLFDIFDPNKTVKHVSYKEMKARYERDRRRSDLVFTILAWASAIGFVILWIAQLQVR